MRCRETGCGKGLPSIAASTASISASTLALSLLLVFFLTRGASTSGVRFRLARGKSSEDAGDEGGMTLVFTLVFSFLTTGLVSSGEPGDLTTRDEEALALVEVFLDLTGLPSLTTCFPFAALFGGSVGVSLSLTSSAFRLSR